MNPVRSKRRAELADRGPRRLERRTGILQHPADRQDGDSRRPFDHLAERASFVASSPAFFGLCIAVVLAWAVGLLLGASNRFEAASAGLMSATTLVLVALMKNTELRAERAIQHKLDAIARSLLEDRRGHDGQADQELERAIGLHDQI